jgi:hypothetical protein
MKNHTRELENKVQHDIMRALGCLPDIIVYRNTVGQTTMYNADTGAHQHVTFGLCPGSADLVCMLRVEHAGRVFAQWVCLEIKRPGEKPRPDQAKWANAVKQMGAFATYVTSVEEALAAVERAREGRYE